MICYKELNDETTTTSQLCPCASCCCPCWWSRRRHGNQWVWPCPVRWQLPSSCSSPRQTRAPPNPRSMRHPLTGRPPRHPPATVSTSRRRRTSRGRGSISSIPSSHSPASSADALASPVDSPSSHSSRQPRATRFSNR